MGSLDVVGMFSNVPLKTTLKVAREKLENDDTLQIRTKWEIDDIMKLLEISIETYFKILGRKIKSFISKEMNCLLENLSPSHERVFICIGLKELMYIMTILCFGNFK